MARVRRHLHGERAIDPSRTEVIAYWRQGSSRADLERGAGGDDDE
jgi:NADPH-dependent ferric siderophore reductase